MIERLHLKMLFLAVTAFLVLTGQIGAYVVESQQADRLKEEIQDLQGKMDTVLEEVEKLDKISEDVEELSQFSNKVDDIFSSYNIGEGEAGVIQQPESEESGDLPVTVKEVRRKVLPDDFVRYSVRFVKNMDYKIIVHTKLATTKRHIIRVDGEVEEAIVDIKTNEDFTPIFFSFFNQDDTIYMTVEMGAPDFQNVENRNSRDEETGSDIVVRVQETQVPLIRTNPSTELVYEEGRDSEVTVFGMSEDDAFYSIQEYFYDLDLHRIRPRYGNHESDDFIIRDKTPKNITGGREWTVTFKTSEKRVSGVLCIVAYKMFSQREVLKSIAVSNIIVLRPSNQPRPYPKGVVGFYDSPYGGDVDEDGAQVLVCNREEDQCGVECEAYGENITGLSAKRILPDGRTEPVKESITFGTDYIRPLFIPVTPGQQKSQKFRCIATSSDGAIVTKDSLVKFVLYPKILENSTSAQVLENANHRIVELECGAKGDPLPQVTFSLHFQNESMRDALADDLAASTDGTEIFATKTVTWDADVKGPLMAIFCTASSDTGRSDFERISIPGQEPFLDDSMVEYMYFSYTVDTR